MPPHEPADKPDDKTQPHEERPAPPATPAQEPQAWRPDSIINALHSQVVGGEAPHVLVGYPGNSDREQVGPDTYRRVYLTPALDRYVDILDSHIVHSEYIVATVDSPLSRVIVWVKRDALLQYTRQIEAQFLSGNITREFLDKTRGASGVSTVAPELLCGYTVHYPRSLLIPCCNVTLCI